MVGVLSVQFVLRSAWQIDVSLALPWLLVFKELCTVELVYIGLADVIARGTQFQHIFYLFVIKSGGVIDVAIRSTDGNDLGTQFSGLLGGTPCHIAEAADGDGLALDVEAVGLQHLVDEVQSTIACSLGTNLRAAPFDTLARQYALELMRQFLVLSVQITYFAGTYADVTSGYILVWTDVTIEFRHESLTETHHLVVRATTNGEVGTALATTHGQRGQGVLESLFEAQELQDAEVHGRVEAQSALVWTDGAVKLYPVADVDMYLAFIVCPRHAECDDALRFHETFNQFRLLEFRVLVINILNRD